MADSITPKYSLLKVKKEDSFNTFTQNYNNILLEELDKDFASKLGKDDYIEANDLKYEILYDIDTGETSELFNDPTYQGYLVFCDAQKFNLLLADRETNIAKIREVLTAFSYLFQSFGGFTPAELQQIQNDIFVILDLCPSELLVSRTPCMYKSSVQLDETRHLTRVLVFRDNKIISLIEGTYDSSTGQTTNSKTTVIPSNSTVHTKIQRRLIEYVNANISDSTAKSATLNVIDTLFTLYSDTDDASSFASVGAYNKHQQLVAGLLLQGRYINNLVELEVDLSSLTEYNKETMKAYIKAGNEVSLKNYTSLIINDITYTKISALETLADYLLVLKVKTTDGDLHFLSIVINGFQVVGALSMEDAATGNESYGLILPFTTMYRHPYYVGNSVRYHGVIDVVGGVMTTYDEPKMKLYLASKYSNTEYTANSVSMYKEPENFYASEKELISINNVFYPSIDLDTSKEPTDEFQFLAYNKTQDSLGYLNSEGLNAFITSSGSNIPTDLTKDGYNYKNAYNSSIIPSLGLMGKKTVDLVQKFGDGTQITIYNVISTQISDVPLSTCHLTVNKVDSNLVKSYVIAESGLSNDMSQFICKFTGTADAGFTGVWTRLRNADGSVPINIPDKSITNTKIADATITGAKIANDTITATQIAANAITSAELANNAVDTAALSASAVTAAKIADGAVTTNKIANLGVTVAKIADATITGAKIANDTITATQIATNAITAAELANNAVVEAKIASNAITTAKIKDASVTDAKLSGVISNAHGGLGGALTASDGRRLAYVSTTGSNTPEKVATYTGRYRTTTWVNYPTNASNGAQGELYNYNWNEGNASTANGWGYQEFITPIGEVWYRVRNNGKYTAKTGWQKIRASNGAATLVDVNAVIAAIKANPGAVRAALGLGSLSTLNSINLSDTTKTTGILPSSRGGFDYQNYLG